MRLTLSRTAHLARSGGVCSRSPRSSPPPRRSPRRKERAVPVNLLEPNAGLMVWTLVVFIGLIFVLKQFAFKPLFAAVEERERALDEAIEGAKRDREAAAAAAGRAQGAAGRRARPGAAAHRRRPCRRPRRCAPTCSSDTRQQQAEMLEQARRDIEGETAKAIAELRREAVDLAIAGAGKVIEQNLDTAGNRRIVEQFLVPRSTAPKGRSGMSVQGSTTGRNYAEALLTLATKAGDPAGWGEMLRQIADAIESRRDGAARARVAAHPGRGQDRRSSRRRSAIACRT